MQNDTTPAVEGARFGHVNIIARDWRALAVFYQRVFGCTQSGPERDLSGTWLDRATGVTAARINGVHLRLPGHGASGPTLEIFQYPTSTSPSSAEPLPPCCGVDRPGLRHIAFAVADVNEAVEQVVRHGGSRLGDVVDARVEGAGVCTFAYCRDPEGNVIELQKWNQGY